MTLPRYVDIAGIQVNADRVLYVRDEEDSDQCLIYLDTVSPHVKALVVNWPIERVMNALEPCIEASGGTITYRGGGAGGIYSTKTTGLLYTGSVRKHLDTVYDSLYGDGAGGTTTDKEDPMYTVEHAGTTETFARRGDAGRAWAALDAAGQDAVMSFQDDDERGDPHDTNEEARGER